MVYPIVKSHQKFTLVGYPVIDRSRLPSRVEKFIQETDLKKARRLWDNLGVTPENIESFKYATGPELFERFQSKTLEWVRQAYLNGHSDEWMEVLRKIVYEEIHEDFYKLDDTAKLRRNDQRECREVLHRSRLGTELFEDLKRFLKSDVLAESGKKKGERKLNEASTFVSCWQNDAEVLFDAEIPRVVTVKEGEDVLIPIQVRSNAHILDGVKLYWHADYADSYFSSRANVLQNEQPLLNSSHQNHRYVLNTESFLPMNFSFKTDRNIITHHQEEIPILFEWMPEGLPWLKVQKRVLVKMDNQNETPIVKLQAPSHVDEGEEVCFKAAVKDPEDDPLVREWVLKKADGTLLSSYTNEQGDVCVKAPVTGRFEYPIDATLTVQDVIDTEKYPTLRSESASASARVFIDPLIALPTGETVKPSASVVETMSKPETKKPQTGGLATDSHLYVFLRLPNRMEDFQLFPPSGDIVPEIALQGEKGKAHGYTRRHWSSFKKAPSATPVAVSSSPIRRWTQKGVYDLDKFSLEVYDREKDGNYFQVPLNGKVKIDSPKINVSIDILENCEGNDCRYRLRMTHLTDKDGKHFIDAPEKLKLVAFAYQDTSVGEVELSRWVEGVKKEDGKADEIIYEIPVHGPEGFVSSAKVKLEMEFTNRYGERATVEYSTEHEGGNRSLLEKLHFKLEPHLLPDPWFLMHMEGLTQAFGAGAVRLLPDLKTDLEICPSSNEAKRFVRDCTDLENDIAWNQVQSTDTVLIPLRPTGYQTSLASAYRAVGGKATGRVVMQFPGDLVGGNNEAEPWGLKIDLPAVDMTLPPDPTIKVDWDKILDMPQYAFLALAAAKGVFEEELEATVKFSTGQRALKPGEKFYVDMSLTPQNKAGTIRLKGLTNNAWETKRLIKVHVRPEEKRRKDLYTLKARSLQVLNKEKIRVTFRLPTYLPAGDYVADIGTSRNVYADYHFTYVPEGPFKVKMWKKEIPVVIWNHHLNPELSDLTIQGDPDILPPSASARRD